MGERIDSSIFSARSIRGALHALSDARRLGEHPLAACRFVRVRFPLRQTPNTVALGHALRAALSQAIQSLKPAGAFDPNDAGWRYYTILHEQYERRRMPEVVMSTLVVEKSQYFSLQARALAELGHVLAGWEQAQTQAQADAAEPQSGPMPIFMAPAMTGKVFLGREALLRQMAAHLLQGRSVAMHGLPGVGKSTFAAALAHRPEMRLSFPDGVLWAGLGQGSDPFAWLGEWAAALGLPRAELAYLTTLEARANAVHTAISTRRMLLVIDDAWTSDPSTGSGALALRVGGPNCAHLLTTRLASVAADFAGPNAFGLPELNEANGLAVLIEHAPALAHTPQVATELARAVGNLPLALTLMGRYAHRAAHGSPRRLQAALDALQQAEARLALAQLTGPLDPDGKGNGASQRSLQTAIGLSDAALDDSARRAFYALSVFPPKPNTFSEEAALAVTGEPPEALDALVDSGLLEVEDGRYTLHPVVADYTRVNQNVKTAPYRFTNYFVNAIITNPSRDWASDTDFTNAFAAISSAAHQSQTDNWVKSVNLFSQFLEVRGMFEPAKSLLADALTKAEASGNTQHIAQTLANLARQHLKLGAYSQAIAMAQQGLKVIHRDSSPETAASLLAVLSESLDNIGLREEAQNHLQEALSLARRTNNRKLLSTLLMGEAIVEGSRSDYQTARQSLSDGLANATTAQNSFLISAFLTGLGMIAYNKGNVSEGDAKFDEAILHAQSVQGHPMLQVIHSYKGWIALNQGAYARSVQLTTIAESHSSGWGFSEGDALVYMNRATIKFCQGRFAESEGIFAQGLARSREADHKASISYFLVSLGRLHLAQTRLQSSKEYLEEGIALARHLRRWETVASGLTVLGNVSRQTGDLIKAESYLNEAASIALSIENAWLQCFTSIGLGEVFHDLGDAVCAQAHFTQALRIAEMLNAAEHIGDALFGLARASAVSDLAKAREYAVASRDTYAGTGHYRKEAVSQWLPTLGNTV